MGRSMRPTPPALVLLAVLGLLALAPAASAETALEQYQRSGRIDSCTATGAPGDIPSDVEQYAPDFLEAYRAAQRNGCNKGNVSETTPTDTDAGIPVGDDGAALPPGARFVPKPPSPPEAAREEKVVRHQPLSVSGETNTPAPLLALALMLLLALVGGALAATARYMGWGVGDRLDPVRHSFGEARLRASDGLSALADRLRALVRRGA